MTSSSSSLRCFFSLKPPDKIIQYLKKTSEEIADLNRGHPTSIRVQDVNQLHLTLLFLGNINISLITQLDQLLSERLSDQPAITLTTQGLKLFPGARKPVCIVASVELTEALHQLHHEVKNCCTELSLTTETRQYRPHITLARLKNRRGNLCLSGRFTDLTFPVTELILYKSTTTQAGSLYEVIATWPLGTHSS